MKKLLLVDRGELTHHKICALLRALNRVHTVPCFTAASERINRNKLNVVLVKSNTGSRDAVTYASSLNELKSPRNGFAAEECVQI